MAFVVDNFDEARRRRQGIVKAFDPNTILKKRIPNPIAHASLLPSVTPTETPTVTPTSTVTVTPTVTPTKTPTPTVTPTISVTPTVTPTNGLTPTPTETPTETPTPTGTASCIPTTTTINISEVVLDTSLSGGTTLTLTSPNTFTGSGSVPDDGGVFGNFDIIIVKGGADYLITITGTSNDIIGVVWTGITGMSVDCDSIQPGFVQLFIGDEPNGQMTII